MFGLRHLPPCGRNRSGSPDLNHALKVWQNGDMAPGILLAMAFQNTVKNDIQRRRMCLRAFHGRVERPMIGSANIQKGANDECEHRQDHDDPAGVEPYHL